MTSKERSSSFFDRYLLRKHSKEYIENKFDIKYNIEAISFLIRTW